MDAYMVSFAGVKMSETVENTKMGIARLL